MILFVIIGMPIDALAFFDKAPKIQSYTKNQQNFAKFEC